MNKSMLVILTSVVVFLSGCVTAEYDDVNDKNTAVQQRIKEGVGRENFQKVVRINRPPVDTTPIIKSIDSPWMNSPVAINAASLPLTQVMKQQLFINLPEVKVFYGHEVNPRKIVNLQAKGTREEVLNQLSLATGYGFVVKENSIKIVRHIQKTYSVLLPTGQYSGQLGSQGKSGEEKDSRIEGQYLNVEYANVNVFREISDGIKEILRRSTKVTTSSASGSQNDGAFSESQEQTTESELEGAVTAVPSMAAISVVTTPERMARVDEYMAYYDRTLRKQVRVEVQILFFQSNNGRERGIDWTIAKDLGDGNMLNFFIPGTNILSPESGYGLAFEGGGKWSGTEALVRWLDIQGSVSSTVPVTQTALNTQPVRISQIINVPFVDTISSDATSDIISADVKRDEKVEGIDLMVTPNVQDDAVWLRVAGKYSQIIDRETKVVANEQLEFLTTQDAEINFTGKLRYDQAIIIGSTSQTVNTADKTASYSLNVLGGNTVNEKVIETLIILTPRRAG